MASEHIHTYIHTQRKLSAEQKGTKETHLKYMQVATIFLKCGCACNTIYTQRGTEQWV